MVQASTFVVRMKRVAGSRRILTFGLLLVPLIAASLLLIAKPAHAASTTFTVNSTGDENDWDFPDDTFDGSSDGKCDVDSSTAGEQCTLRAAIEEANGTSAADTIKFNIPGDGPHTISPSSSLPEITDPVVIDGYSQPGSKPNTLTGGNNAVLKIELSGANAGQWASGLRLQATDSTVKGLAINRWDMGGVFVLGTGTKGNKIEGNFIGTDASGTQGLGNSSGGVWLDDASNNTVGGTSAAARNVISGNEGPGVQIDGTEAKDNKVQGNYVGTKPNGLGVLANSGIGVYITAPTSTVGGVTAAARNVISGNGDSGVYIGGVDAEDSKVQGNRIGTDPWGTAHADLGNHSNGVTIAHAPNTTVGGTVAGAGNLISNNSSHGVVIYGTGAKGSKVQGNRIGTDPWGDFDIGNFVDGVVIWDAPNTTVGGTTTETRNLISGNNWYGVHIFGTEAKGNKVQGNFIGTDASGTRDLGNSLDGVFIEAASADNAVGGTEAGTRNLISGNNRNGVYIYGASATGNSILSNSIHSNGSLGIDLTRTSFPPVPDGVTGNDVDDADTGPNNLQNYPVINSVPASSQRITIKGTLISIPNRTFTIQFFSNPSGTDEGQKLVGQKVVTTDANGDASFTFSKRKRVPLGREITATATIHDATDTSKLLETSEFSAPMSVLHGS